MSNHFLSKNFIACESGFAESDVVLFGAPFDGTTTNRPGARFASQAIRNESIGLETYSPYFERDLEDFKIHDPGDLDLPFGNVEKALQMIFQTTEWIIQENKKPFMIGGEHLVSLPAIKAVFDKYKDLHIIHLDAHTDLREDYLGEKLSHSTVIRRVWDFVGDNKIFQFGIRSGTREEFQWAADHVHLNKFDFTGLSEAVCKMGSSSVYLTVDLDVLDPSIMPGTGTTEAGGVTFKELIAALKEISVLNIVGCDLVELSPHYDNSGASTAVACKIAREMLMMM